MVESPCRGKRANFEKFLVFAHWCPFVTLTTSKSLRENLICFGGHFCLVLAQSSRWVCTVLDHRTPKNLTLVEGVGLLTIDWIWHRGVGVYFFLVVHIKFYKKIEINEFDSIMIQWVPHYTDFEKWEKNAFRAICISWNCFKHTELTRILPLIPPHWK